MWISPFWSYFAQNVSFQNLLNYRTLHHSEFPKMHVLVWRATHPILQCKNTFSSLKYIIIVQPCYVIALVVLQVVLN